MKFTKKNSLQDILSCPGMKAYLNVFYSQYLLELYPKEMMRLPLETVEKEAVTPWNDPFSDIADQLLLAAKLAQDLEDGTYRAVPLWQPHGTWQPGDGKDHGEKDDVVLIAPREQRGRKRPAVIICPGGGYTEVCFSGEGTPVLKEMERAGYGAFMLRYRVAPAVYPMPQEDLVLAVKYVQSHAENYGVDPDNILLIGFSAGAHLCALTAARYTELEKLLQEELRRGQPELARQYQEYSRPPGKIGLAYPVISFCAEPHEGSAEMLTGGRREWRSALSVENLVTKDYPRTFIWTCADDDLVPPGNTLRMMMALDANHVPYEGHIYPTGGHGCALAHGKSADGWLERLIRFMEQPSTF